MRISKVTKGSLSAEHIGAFLPLRLQAFSTWHVFSARPTAGTLIHGDTRLVLQRAL